MKLDKYISFLKNYKKNLKIMEVCGTHTSSIVKNGINSLVSPSIKLVSGPGCPVCVTPSAYIDSLVDFSLQKANCVLSFGDMLKVKGSRLSLAEAKALGADVRLVYSPLDSIRLAMDNPAVNFVFAAVGFETTIPIYAIMINHIIRNKIKNLRLCTALKTMLPALEFICANEEIDGFICPGHVSVIIGSEAYSELCRKSKKPFVIAGFSPEQIIGAVSCIALMHEREQYRVDNLYTGVVTANGNTKATNEIAKYFEAAGALWRGLGYIDNSALILKNEYRHLDFPQYSNFEDKQPSGCKCKEVILGRIVPPECELFGKLCKPDNPIGACMVSSEGSCGIWYDNAE